MTFVWQSGFFFVLNNDLNLFSGKYEDEEGVGKTDDLCFVAGLAFAGFQFSINKSIICGD